MPDTRTELLDLIITEHAFDHHRDEIEPKQLEAADALLQELRERIPVLDRRANETGVDNIKSFDDIVPLLFAHTVYKSYPETFIAKKRWDRMLAWLSTLSADDLTTINMDGVETADDWLDRLKENDCMVLSTSGSSGKCSFLPASKKDKELKVRHFTHAVGWPDEVANNQYEAFWTGPIQGPNSAIESGEIMRDYWAKPGGFHNLIKAPLKITDVSAGAAFMKSMRDGTATPADIEAFEKRSKESALRMEGDLREFTDELLAHRREPVMVSGLWAQHLQIIERAYELGVPDGDFHPNSVIQAGGGVKGVALPEDYKERVARFYGDVRRPGAYGMTEMAQVMPRCSAMRYHRPAGLIWLLLDKPGERLINAREGVVEGRFAFLDLLYTGRWGGVITGDKVEIDWNEQCPCGRPGPTILDTISRFAQTGEDDHIGCAGTIDGYVRGAMG